VIEAMLEDAPDSREFRTELAADWIAEPVGRMPEPTEPTADVMSLPTEERREPMSWPLTAAALTAAKKTVEKRMLMG